MLITRRAALFGLVAAPAVIRVASLMPIKPVKEVSWLHWVTHENVLNPNTYDSCGRPIHGWTVESVGKFNENDWIALAGLGRIDGAYTVSKVTTHTFTREAA